MPQNISKNGSRDEAGPSAPYGSEVSYFAWRRGFATQAGRDALGSAALPRAAMRPPIGH
jgi:hypothetical protein